jgi:hypothetical protein
MPIQQIYNTKLLGIYLDDSLTWGLHTDYATEEVNTAIFIFCKMYKMCQ